MSCGVSNAFNWVSVDWLQVLHKLGNVCMKQKSFDAAMEYYTEAISRQNKLHSPSQKLQLAEGLLGKATVYFLTNEMRDSKIYLTRAKELATDVLGQRHHFVAAITNRVYMYIIMFICNTF